MRLGVFGGSFDPPHLSHALACHWALESGVADRVLMIPCARHVFEKRLNAPFEDRLEMCRLAVRRLAPWVEVLDLESRREGASYTIETLRALRPQYPADEFRLLIGSDLLGEVARWRDWEEIQRLAPPVVIPRLTGEPPPRADTPASPDLSALSSTWIRERLARGEIPEGAISASVTAYIVRRGLYGFRSPNDRAPGRADTPLPERSPERE